uniref:L-gulonolactone oxidase-like n=1 Tax=Callorhinchus milii TaxID=7868 RepID=A0A4W3GDT8_CALMI|eukprot:gi/632991914/ref/XP_007884839.1/ PREDICTED: L-gulonolactone oxidase-like [Callorhinchus milii]
MNVNVADDDVVVVVVVVVCRHRAGEALRQLQVWLGRHEGETAHFPVEVRFARGDDILLSPCYRQDSCYINIIAYRPYGREPQRERYWAAYEAIMRENGGRPHWAKVGQEPVPTL